jgi:5-methylcytosine-specific restriction endonuclease McrA
MNTNNAASKSPRKRSAASRASDKKYKEEHREHAHEIYLAYYSRPEIRERMAAQSRAWHSVPENKVKSRKYIREHPEAGAKWRRNNPIRHWASSTLRDHKRRGYVAKVAMSEIAAIAERSPTCFYCGIELDYSPNKGVARFNSPTMDRRDNQLEFTANDVNIICVRCNASKSDRTHAEYILYLKNTPIKRRTPHARTVKVTG